MLATGVSFGSMKYLHAIRAATKFLSLRMTRIRFNTNLILGWQLFNFDRLAGPIEWMNELERLAFLFQPCPLQIKWLRSIFFLVCFWISLYLDFELLFTREISFHISFSVPVYLLNTHPMHATLDRNRSACLQTVNIFQSNFNRISLEFISV